MPTKDSSKNSSQNNQKNLRIRLLNQPVNPNIVIIIVAIYIVATANFGFFNHVLSVYPFATNAGFIISIVFFLFALIWFLFQLLCYRYTTKAVLIFMIIVAAVCGYFTDSYGTIFDTNMLVNTIETDHAEAMDLIEPNFIIRVLLLGVFPVVVIANIGLKQLSWKLAVGQKMLSIMLALCLIALCVIPKSDQYASFFRQHKAIRYYANPITPIYSAVNLGKTMIDDARRPNTLIAHATDAQHIEKTVDSKPKLMVFVVGEAARADHMNLNGYERETMPLLAKLSDIYSFRQAMSCGTSTAYSVPCMFSYDDRNDFDVDMAEYNENVIDTLSKMGVTVIWRDNNSSSKGVADRVLYEDYKTGDLNPDCQEECRDMGMLTGFDDMVSHAEKSGAPSKDTLIVLHQMGNHGPAYYKRYPKEFEEYTPVCQSSELSKCDNQSVINGYDNALRYTDFFLNAVIDNLKKYENDYDVVMLYMSDHGESLGENNVYLHGLPYGIAPKYQKHIPAIIWSPVSNNIDVNSIKEQLDQEVSQDYITPSLLAFFGISTEEVAGKPTFFKTK